MILSKPLVGALSFYFEQLFTHPLRTKAVSSCIIASAGNYVSQCIAGNKVLNHQSILAYGVFGLLFGGTFPHYFYGFLERIVPEDAAFAVVRKLFFERLIYSPLYQAFSLYVIARLEGKSHDEAVAQLKGMYWIILTSSWKYLTILQLLNLSVVPPVLRVLVMNLVGFLWIIYFANKRRQLEAKRK